MRAMNRAFSILFGPALRRMPEQWSATILDVWPTVLFNFMKGAFAAGLAYLVIGSQASAVFTGIAAIWGHTWPVFNRFRGERGISVILGVSSVVAPISTVIWCGLWLVMFSIVRYSSVASVVSFLALPFLMWEVRRRDLFVVFGVVCSLIAIAQLYADLQRLALGKSKPADEGGSLSESEIQEEEERRDEPTRWSRLKARLAIGIFAFLVVLFWFGNKYVYRGFGLQVPIIRAGGPYYKTVALTFDDGPDPAYTPEILDILKQNNVKATFFVVGRHAEEYPDLVKRIAQEGHEIGSHSYSHPFNLVMLSKERMKQEVTRSEQVITKITGKRPYLFRPPRGIYNKSLTDFLMERKYTMVLWTLSSRDWQEPSYKEITWRVTTGIRPGDIVLFHDSGSIIMPEGGNRMCTIQALPYIIKDLKEKGYRFVTVSDMIIMSDLNGNIQ